MDAPEADAALELVGEFAQAGNPHGNPDIVRVNASKGGNSAAYLAARLKKAGRDDLLQQIGPDKPFRSIRAAYIRARLRLTTEKNAAGERCRFRPRHFNTAIPL